ncbi:putative CCR4-associated factor 1-like protein 7 [Diplonema papillatum]|nr:putative CCR4-associated factor 1-like protein 7 [Diplonema papillatum]
MDLSHGGHSGGRGGAMIGSGRNPSMGGMMGMNQMGQIGGMGMGGQAGMHQLGMGQMGSPMDHQMGFHVQYGTQYGAGPGMPQDQHQQYELLPPPQSHPQHLAPPPPEQPYCDLIIDVWAEQLEAAFDQIRATVVDYPYVAMDTEFPGVVARPIGSFKSNTEFYYQTLRCNVNLLKIIQLGITFSDENGKQPPGPCTWQFNFKFNLTDDIYAQDSIDLLTGSGIDFERFAREGIEVATFAELLTSSGLVLSSDPPVRWLSFHSGYDFGYLIKVLTNNELPLEEEGFFELMETYFPLVFDVKYLLKQTGGALSDMCGLNKLGEDLDVQRIGPAHQAGSDSLLTSHCFFKLAQEFFSDGTLQKHCGILYGLGQDKGNDITQPNQNSWNPATANPAITPSTPGGGGNTQNVQNVQNGNVINQFPSSPSPQITRGPQPGLYHQGR